ncbi:MAG TPA: hypothetical protein VI318_23260 [Baekduia sp.]
MTPPHLHRSSGLLARSALATLVLAGGASAAATAAQQGTTAPQAPAPRVAVLAGSDASAAQIAAATPTAGDVTVRGAGGTFEAQAQATRLAAEGYDTVIGVGAQARAAVSQAAGGEVGAGTHWQTASH